MISSKAIELLKTFSEEEFRKFGLFVSSPYFNKENIQVKFYGLLKKYYPEFDNRNFDKEKIFFKLYPGKRYNDGMMRNILSTMLEHAQNFLAASHMQKDSFNISLSLMKELNRRKMEKLFEKAEVETTAILEKTASRNGKYYYNKFQLFAEKSSFIRHQKSVLYKPNDMLKTAEENLTISFLISIMHSQTNMANTNLRMFRIDSSPSIEELETYIDKAVIRYKDITYLQYYYNTYKLARLQDEKYFYELKQISERSFNEFNEEEKRDIFTILTNYCYFRINKGDLHFRKEHFLLYKENIVQGHYKGNRKYLDHILYLNVSITGIDSGETEWVENFIKQYKAELDEVNRENTYNFVRALVYYHKKLYSEAFDWAAKVKTDDLSYKHQLKSFYLKIYFDMNETEPFYSHVDSYRHFLVNEKHIPEVTRNVIGSYLSFTKRLFDIKNSSEEKDYDLMKIKKEVVENTSMINKPWLLERIDLIMNKKAAT